MLLLFGWIGAALLAICGAPLAIQAIRQKDIDTNIVFLLSWYFGEIITLVYVFLQYGFEWPLLFNYGLNIIFITRVLFKHEIWR